LFFFFTRFKKKPPVTAFSRKQQEFKKKQAEKEQRIKVGNGAKFRDRYRYLGLVTGPDLNIYLKTLCKLNSG